MLQHQHTPHNALRTTHNAQHTAQHTAHTTHGCCAPLQLIIFMALASGRSRMLCGELTLHTRTAMVVAEALTACKFKVHEREGGLWLVECQGAGHIAPC